MANTLVTSGLVAVIAAGSVFALMKFVDEPAPTALAAPDVSGLEARLKALEHQQADALARLDAATSALNAAATQRTEEKAAHAAELAAVQQSDGNAQKPAAPPAAADATMTDAAFAATIGELLAQGTSHESKAALWEKLKAAGKLEAAIEQMEELADDDPQNPDLRSELGSAYLQKLFTVAEGPQKGIWAMKADTAFDQALAIDPQHWDARFSKAVSLSFWPPVFGKQGDAVANFETLMQQQEASGTNKPEFVHTYIFLGNMYAGQGNAAKAKEIWSKGAGKFPSNEELKNKISN